MLLLSYQISINQKAAKALCPPENHFRHKIQSTANQHSFPVADPVCRPAPWNLQADRQKQTNAFDQRDLKNADSRSLPVKGCHRRVKHHAMQQRNGIEKI